ncbi:MAG: Uma2 family endonuclease [Synechococcales bacterium]|nr:Uma2 family endonuclease [Synechococcales bacterium]
MSDRTAPSPLIEYPESDGQPMTESDPTRDYLLYCVAVLESYFRSRRQVYVSGNLFIYYEQGNPKKVISPDVFVIFGVRKCKRRSYKTWEEGDQLPSFILEVTSRTTQRQDEVEKPALYERLGVMEYFQYDPTGDYLQPQLKGQRLVNGLYQPIALQPRSGGFYMHSQELGLDLCLQMPQAIGFSQPAPQPVLPLELRFCDPKTNSFLLSYQELEEARSQAEMDKLQAEQALQQATQVQRTAIVRLTVLGLTAEQIADALSLAVQAVQVIQSEPEQCE